MLGKRAPQFITSVLQCVASNALLAKADPTSIYQAAAVAATLDLPINNSLGHAWIVPYKGQAQFQLGWKGLVQLAQRTGQYIRINVTEVYASQYKGYNALTEDLDADFSIEGEGPVVGYVAYFRLVNGFEKTVYWSRAKVEKHAKRYSQAYQRGGMTPWADAEQFHEMAKKTVLKNTLSKWGPLSIEMQRAVVVDQGVVRDYTTGEVDYVDAEAEVVNKEEERVSLMIDDAKSIDDLYVISEHLSTDALKEKFEAKKNELFSKEEVSDEA